MKRMRVMGFSANSDEQQQSEQESKIDYVRMALDAYFEGGRLVWIINCAQPEE